MCSTPHESVWGMVGLRSVPPSGFWSGFRAGLFTPISNPVLDDGGTFTFTPEARNLDTSRDLSIRLVPTQRGAMEPMERRPEVVGSLPSFSPPAVPLDSKFIGTGAAMTETEAPMRIPPQLVLMIAEQGGLVDLDVLVRYSAFLDRMDAAERRLEGGITAASLTDAADMYRRYRQAVEAHTAEFSTAYQWTHSSPMVKRISALNIGISSGLPLQVLCHSCLFNITIGELLEEITEGGAVGTPENVTALLAIDEALRVDASTTYMELTKLYSGCGIATDMRSWVERWAKRRGWDGPERAHRASGEKVRQRALDLWVSEQAMAMAEGRKPKKAMAWRGLIAIAEQATGTGDDAELQIDGIAVTKMAFYQWLHRADRGDYSL